VTSDDSTLVDLLGDTRAQVVQLLRREPRSVADLAAALELSEVAVRRHLQVLERDGLISAETVRGSGPGRPWSRYRLTSRANRLFPDASAAFASDLMEFVEQEHGRGALLAFLRWRHERQGSEYAARMVAAENESTEDRVALLAELLDSDGFMAEATPVTAEDGATMLQLRQTHCAVKDIAAAHPEICAYEAAMFKELLGAKVSRRQTIAGGADACVCTVTPADPARPDVSDDRTRR
jgi:predicted ArsR family transcriptional regulator